MSRDLVDKFAHDVELVGVGIQLDESKPNRHRLEISDFGWKVHGLKLRVAATGQTAWA